MQANDLDQNKFANFYYHSTGEIVSLTVFGTTIVVLNNKDDATNLLDKRSTIYSDRTCPPMIQEPSLYAYAEFINTKRLCSLMLCIAYFFRLDWGGFGSLVGYGDRWRKYRRLMNPWLTKQAVASHHGDQERATRKLLQRLLERRQKYMCSHELECELFLSISATLLHSIYGYEAMTSDDHYLVETQAILSFLAGAALSSNYLVNILPILKHVPDWLPGAGWKRDAIKWRTKKEALIKDIYKIGLKNMSNNEGAPVMVASLRADALGIGLTEDEADDYVSQIAITMFSGGTDTTVNTLIMFFMAMVLYPDVQKRAQAEIDSVLGHSRLPQVEDRPRLKYVDRVVQETLRWGPVTPIAVPHTCFKDDIYKSYRIPKGAIVMGNVWAMTRDKNVYKDPEVFEPDRYLDPTTPFSPVFGWGRRRCPGIHLGQSSLFITIASILMTFDIGTIIDSDGKEVLPSGKMINAIVLTPERFEFELTPRSAKHEELIRSGL